MIDVIYDLFRLFDVVVCLPVPRHTSVTESMQQVVAVSGIYRPSFFPSGCQ